MVSVKRDELGEMESIKLSGLFFPTMLCFLCIIIYVCIRRCDISVVMYKRQDDIDMSKLKIRLHYGYIYIYIYIYREREREREGY